MDSSRNPSGLSRLPDANNPNRVTIRLHPTDDVVIATADIGKGSVLVMESGAELVVRDDIGSGHKIAVAGVASGGQVRRYGQVIGKAARTIVPGEHVHRHNLTIDDALHDLEPGANAVPTTYVPAASRRTFEGFKRASGRVGTRNYVAVVGTVNCSAHVCRQIAAAFGREELRAFPNVDGVIALTHTSGCGGGGCGTADHTYLQQTLGGMIRHPNIAASLVVGLGCESQQIADLIEDQHLAGDPDVVTPVALTIQEIGGIRKAVSRGSEVVRELLPAADKVRRTPQPISELSLALECGGSDGWSGITSNPLIGRVADEIVRSGGTAVLSETTEIFGAEHLLVRRAERREVARKLLDKLDGWRLYVDRAGETIDNNPSPGNKAGGLTNIVEKSLGAISKSGTTNLVDVYDYAAPITARGFVFMDSPGFDPASITGKVAGGCNLVLFSTGRGSVFGFKPAPSIKISSNSATFERMSDDMDVNGGRVLEPDESLESISAELLDLVIAVASGTPSKSEEQDVGSSEFIPWQPGVML